MQYRKALILGGSSGLGLEIAKYCLLESRAREILTASSSNTDRHEGNVRTIYCDLRIRECVDSLAYRINNDPGMAGIDLFFWIAGQLTRRDFADLRAEQVREMLDVNLSGPLVIANAAWKQMQMSPRPTHFVVISSSSGIKARPQESVYVAAKHGQVGFARSLALENKDRNLRILLVMPGGMRTPFWSAAQPADFDSFLDPEKVACKIIETIDSQVEPFAELSIPRGSL